jgi:(1->4)-alpha-D-glucan 1-alpha-D-glucosylmutase
MRKATKEAKVHTSWINPNDAYDLAVQNFVAMVLGDPETGRFAKSFQAMHRKVANYGYLNSLAQVMLKLTSPGVPDIYQGNEVWDFSLVDPDNRRPVDYQYRSSLLQNLKQRLESSRDLIPLMRELLNSMPDGRVKLYLTCQVLNFRRAHPTLFAHGAYFPLETFGQKNDHVTAFARIWENDAILVAVPRLMVKLTGGNQGLPLGREVWADTWITLSDFLASEQSYHNILTGEVLAVERHGGGGVGLPLSAIFRSFPVALMKRVGAKKPPALIS